jgi:gliding motility-associated-like protein
VACLLVVPTGETNAQLEIVNGGFETNMGFPNESGMWELIYDWTNAGSSTANPDYYHEYGVDGGDLPETPLAFVQAFEGRGIAGLEVSRRSGTNKREYLSGTFSEPLEIGKKYEFSFAIANGGVYDHSAAGLGVSDLGISFSTTQYIQNEREPLTVHPHFQLAHVQYYQGWKVIKFAFTAHDNYMFFTFGMFGSDDGKVIQSFEGSGRSKAYYFVDDFAIRNVTSELLNYDASGDKGEYNVLFGLMRDTYVPTAFSPNDDGTNDTFEPSLKDNLGAVMQVYDRGGALIWEGTGDNMSWDGMTAFGLKSRVGVYVWVLTVVLEEGRVEQLTGPVTLLN